MRRRSAARHGTALALALFALPVFPGNGHAQTPPPPSPDAIPSREQVEIPRPQDRSRDPSSATVDSRAIERDRCPFDGSSLRPTINQVRFTGPKGESLPPAIESLLSDIEAPGAEQPIQAICAIRDRADDRLRDARYVARVVIPPQSIETGELRLEVVTARIVDVRVRGDAAPYAATLAARRKQLMALHPLNEGDAERILLLASDAPGLNVKLRLRPSPGGQPGDVVGDLEVDFVRAAVLANVQNYGSRQLGRETAFVRADFYGLTGGPSLTYVGGSTTLDFDEQRVVQAGHVQELNLNGLSLGADFLYAWSRPDLGDLDLRSESLIARLEAGLPLIRSVTKDLDLAAGFELIEQRTRVFGSGEGGTPLNRDKLRVLFARLSGGLRRTNGDGTEAYSLAGSIELRKGIDVFGATRRGFVSPTSGYSPSRIEGDPNAMVVRGELAGVVRLGPVFSLAAEGVAQWANEPLLNFEEFSIGNLTLGRGYDPGANTADRAIGLRIEPRARIVSRPKLTVDIFGFYDSVWIYNLDTNTAENGRRLGSYGGGARLLLPGKAVLEVMYARPEDVPLLIPNARRAPDRLLISLTLQYPPGGR